MISAISVKDRLKNLAMVKVEFTESIEQTKRLLMPIVEAISKDDTYCLKWDKNIKEWI